MSTFEVLVRRIDDVIDHPNADRLSIVKILGYDAITAKVEQEDGSFAHAYAVGDLIVYVPEAAVVPEHLLKQYGFWDATKDDGAGRGMLAGKRGDRVKAVRLRGVLSQGLVWPLKHDLGAIPYVQIDPHDDVTYTTTLFVQMGDDVGTFFAITKYEPPVPVGMGGEVAAVYEFALDFDIENEQNFPGFLDNDEVEATEKLHGTNCRIAYRPDVSHEEMFGSGNVGITSKGMGAKGLMFKNNEANANNLYVRTLVGLDLPARIEALGAELGMKVDLFGEIFGRGVQDLHYGQSTPVFRAFDIAINGTFLSTDEKEAMFARLGVERVPVLYRGPWDRDVLVALRDGKTTLGEQNVKEGIVVTAIGDQSKREFANHRLRPFLKMINPDYLTRKGENVTEYQ